MCIRFQIVVCSYIQVSDRVYWWLSRVINLINSLLGIKTRSVAVNTARKTFLNNNTQLTSVTPLTKLANSSRQLITRRRNILAEYNLMSSAYSLNETLRLSIVERGHCGMLHLSFMAVFPYGKSKWDCGYRVIIILSAQSEDLEKSQENTMHVDSGPPSQRSVIAETNGWVKLLLPITNQLLRVLLRCRFHIQRWTKSPLKPLEWPTFDIAGCYSRVR